MGSDRSIHRKHAAEEATASLRVSLTRSTAVKAPLADALVIAGSGRDKTRVPVNRIACLIQIDKGHIERTVGKHLGTINAGNLRRAPAELESGRSIGKMVLEGF